MHRMHRGVDSSAGPYFELFVPFVTNSLSLGFVKFATYSTKVALNTSWQQTKLLGRYLQFGISGMEGDLMAIG